MNTTASDLTVRDPWSEFVRKEHGMTPSGQGINGGVASAGPMRVKRSASVRQIDAEPWRVVRSEHAALQTDTTSRRVAQKSEMAV